jgi:hypothetical protein
MDIVPTLEITTLFTTVCAMGSKSWYVSESESPADTCIDVYASARPASEESTRLITPVKLPASCPVSNRMIPFDGSLGLLDETFTDSCLGQS